MIYAHLRVFKHVFICFIMHRLLSVVLLSFVANTLQRIVQYDVIRWKQFLRWCRLGQLLQGISGWRPKIKSKYVQIIFIMIIILYNTIRKTQFFLYFFKYKISSITSKNFTIKDLKIFAFHTFGLKCCLQPFMTC